MNLIKYSNVFTEVYVILSHLEMSDYEKIPADIIKTIENNRNQNYNYVMNENMDLDNQIMLPHTKAMLFNIFRDYLATEEQREKIKRMQKEDVVRLMKARKTSSTSFTRNSMNVNQKAILQDANIKELSLAETTKENIWIRILRKVRAIFK
ncbi:MAG: hypothetical protein J6B87_00330 [Clostridia bacterium]|nr:hypothetical protein [Clostridia bacterium]